MNAILPATTEGRRRKTGFSLIEVVLALLLFAMGVLGVLALFPAATVMNRDAQDYTYSAQFARRVFDGILAKAMNDTNFWDILSNQVSVVGCTTDLVVVEAPDSEDFFWVNPASFNIHCYTGVQTVAFNSADEPDVTDHILRYRLTGSMKEMPRNMEGLNTWIVSIVPEDFSTTNPDGTVSNEVTNIITRWWMRQSYWSTYARRYRDKTLHLTLQIWPGRYGSRNSRIYYCYVPRLW